MYIHCQRTLRSFLLIEQCPGPSLDVTTPRDSYTWNYREAATALTLSESFTEAGFEPLMIGSMRNDLTTELSWYYCGSWHHGSKVSNVSKTLALGMLVPFLGFLFLSA